MRFFLLACLLLAFVVTVDSAAPRPPGYYTARWKKIDALLDKNRTTTAAPLVEGIYQEAKREGNGPAYVRALLYKIRLLQNKEQDDLEKSIALLEAELPTATFPARPILHSLLAEEYTAYLNQNRYRLYQRTNGAEPSASPASGADGGTGLATWDMGRLGGAIVRHYYQSVEDGPARQLKTSLASLGDLATGGDATGRALRPSLYDLLANRAIEGLKNQELYLSSPEQQFQLTDPKLFGSAAEFAALRLLAPEADSLNGQVHALHLLQRLTASRQQLAPANPAALADVDLTRIDYLHSLTQNTELAAQYEPALERMAETYKALPISTEFMARRAEAAREANPAEAVRRGREAEARFPKSAGAARAQRLRAELERPEVWFRTAPVLVPNQPWRLDITARNVTALHAWAYRITRQQREDLEQYDRRNRTVKERYAAVLKQTPAATWDMPVGSHPLDYKAWQLPAAGPALPVGYYVVVLSTRSKNPLDGAPGAATAYALLGASELLAVHRYLPQGALQVLALHRQTGQTLSGVSAQAVYQHFEPGKRGWQTRQLTSPPTTETGLLELPAGAKSTVKYKQNEQIREVLLWRGADTLRLDAPGAYFSRGSTDDTTTTCFLFTDRAIYRPGQTVYFKGILVEKIGSRTRLLTKAEQEVKLTDVNGQSVGELSFVTNEFGSFNGSFVLPTSLLNGEFELRADDGELRFSVEDYRRPTFFVTLDSVPGRPQLGQELAMTGRAQAYAGQATGGAAVRYRVQRRALWPMFDGAGYGRGGYQPGWGQPAQEIAHGTTSTDADGRFRIVFTPPLVPQVPGRGRRPGWAPGYVFEVTADVTTPAGETRSATRGLPIGHNPLSLRLVGPALVDKQRLPAFQLLSTNATGIALPATGTLRVLARRLRPALPGVPGLPAEDEQSEAPAELVATLPFDTKAGPRLALSNTMAQLPTGRYRLEALAAGADSARAQVDFTLYDSNSATVPFATPDWFVALADTVAPGQPAAVLIGSSEAGARVLLEVERAGQLLRSEWLTLNAGEQRRLRIDAGPATASGPLHVHTTQVRNNQMYRHESPIWVAEKPLPLQLSIATFRDKLRPGQAETWRVTVRRPDGSAADAELMATLYDQSLDFFRPHRFSPPVFNPGYFPARYQWQGNFGPLPAQQLWSILNLPEVPVIRYPVLNTQYAGGALREGFVRAMADERLYGSSALGGRVAGVQVQSASAASPRIMLRGARPAAPEAADAKQLNEVVVVGYGAQQRADLTASVSTAVESGRPVDLSALKARQDFRETAFWQPALHTNSRGEAVLEFQMPEAVTRWQLLALAHDRNLHTGQLARQLVTQKEIQITANAPRFFRQGDAFTFAAQFSNLTDHATRGTAQLFLVDAATGQDLTGQLLQGPAQQAVAAPAHQSTAVGWEIRLPNDFAPAALTYKVVAQTVS